jgi:1-deoxy-D-xylulose-5-phosphate synthase
MNQPTAVRYPRGSGTGVPVQAVMKALPVGQAELRRQGRDIAFLAFGSMVAPCLEAAEALDATVVNMRWVKPLDEAMVLRMAEAHTLLVTVEENAIMGGAGSAVLEALCEAGRLVRVLQLGLPDRYVDHGDPAILLAECGLNADGIAQRVRHYLAGHPKLLPPFA